MPTERDMVVVYLIVYTFAVFGLAYIVGHSYITQGLRDRLMAQGGAPLGYAVRRTIGTLIECPACFSTWVGGLVGLAVAPYFDMPTWLCIITLACYSAATSFSLGKLTRLID